MNIGLVITGATGTRATGLWWHVSEQKLARKADTIGKLRLHITKAVY